MASVSYGMAGGGINDGSRSNYTGNTYATPQAKTAAAGTYTEYDLSQYKRVPLTSDDFTGIAMKSPDGKTRTYGDKELRQLHELMGMWAAGDGVITSAKVMDNFNRWYALYPDMEMPGNLKSYIFITRPDFNVLNTGSSRPTPSADNPNDPRLQYLCALHPEILWMLSSDMTSDHDFIPYLQGRAESMQLPDFQIRSSQFVVPAYNYKFAYPGVTNESTTGGSFDITFREDDQLRITKLFDFWIYYMDAVNKNILKPRKTHITNHSYDCMCSVYEIICDPTSEMILWWSKYTGCFPTSVSVSNLSFEARGNPDNKVHVTFDYSRIEHMEPEVLIDFRSNIHKTSGTFANIYNTEFDISGTALVSCPYLQVSSRDNKLLLKWFKTDERGKIATMNTSGGSLQYFAMNSGVVANWKNGIDKNPYYANATQLRANFDRASATAAQQDIGDQVAALRQSFNTIAKRAVAAAQNNQIDTTEAVLSTYFSDEGTGRNSPPTDDGIAPRNQDLNSSIQTVHLQEDYPLTSDVLVKNHSKATAGLFQ